MVEISLLEPEDERLYEDLLLRSNESMFFHTLQYRSLLEKFLSVKSFVIIAKKPDNIVGALPLFLKENKEYGNILNSSPYYGSNGGFVLNKKLNYVEKTEIKQELLNKFYELAKENNCVTSTIITSPFDRDIMFYENNIKYSYKDLRIGYIKEFDRTISDPQEAISSTVERKCRGSINRGLKNLELEYSNDFTDFFTLHKNTMMDKGTFKPMELFDIIKTTMQPDDYKLSYAIYNGERIGGNLFFHFKNTIEWFATGVEKEYRSEQPTAYLLYNEMKNGMENGFKYFNFGGTNLPSQLGIANFKHSWGSDEYPYYYYTIIHEDVDRILTQSPDEILTNYKWFYVVPFTELKAPQ